MVETQILSLHPDCQGTKNRTLWLPEFGDGRLRGLKGQTSATLPVSFSWLKSCFRCFTPGMEKFSNVLGDRDAGKGEVNFLVSAFSNVTNQFLSMAFCKKCCDRL